MISDVVEFELNKQQFILNFVNSLPTKPDISHKNPPAILARTVSQTSSFKPQNSLHSSYFPAEVEIRPPSLSSLRGRQSTIVPERIYDEPIAVISPPIGGSGGDLSTMRSNASAGSQDTAGGGGASALDDTSSDEDEPLYYNVLLMKQQSEMQNNNTPCFDQVMNDHSLVIREDNELNDDLSNLEVASLPALLNISPKSPNQSYDWRDHNNSKESLELDLPIGLTKEALQDQKRFGIAKNILKQELVYTTTLDVLRQYKLLFENHKKGSVPFLDIDESLVIFCNIPLLFEMQKRFTDGLRLRVDNWKHDDSIGQLFFELAKEECPLASEYMKNYHQAINMYRKCSEQNDKFREVTQSIPTPAIRNCTMDAKHLKLAREPSRDNTDTTSLEELLYMPVVRIQRHSMTLHELINVTSAKHVDYDVLQRTLKLTQDFLENFTEKQEANNRGTLRYLAKQGLTVQQVRNRRTLRHLFLFRDIIICAKQRISGRQKVHYDFKWSIPLCDLVIPNNISVQDEPTIEDVRHNEITAIECRVIQLQNELKLSIKRMHSDQGNKHITARSIPKHIEKLQKKLAEQEATLLKIAPHLIFTLNNKNSSKTSYSLLMSSDYERSSWKDMILGLQSRVIALNEKFNMSPADQQILINSQKKPGGSRLALERHDLGITQDSLFGLLNITIYSINGLESNSDTFCVIETDSFDHFSVKAKTSIARNKSSPVWNEGFEIDLEGTQTLRILSYKLVNNHDVLLGKCALELSREWLSEEIIEKKITLNEKVQITISLKYTNKDYIKRTPSTAKGVVFGAKLRDVVQREGKFVPIIISSCIEEVERRGINEVGIYRVSGLTGQIQYLKKAFDKNSRLGATMLKENEINVVTSLLKQYFRELPEALFTDDLYPRLMEDNGIADPVQRQKRMIALVKSLPQTNLSVIQYIFRHIVVISERSANKMNLSNLATVFGPTLLKPASKPSRPAGSGTANNKSDHISMEMFNVQARDAINQTGILLFLLTLSKGGVDFSRIH